MQASQTFKAGFFSNFRNVVHQIWSGAARHRKENLKRHILMFRIGGWTGEGNNVFPAHSIYTNLNFGTHTPIDLI